MLALPIALIGTTTAVLGMVSHLRSPSPDALIIAASRLSGQVLESEATALQRLLGDAGDLRAANVNFTTAGLPPVQWRTDAHGDRGSLDDVASYYNSLKRGRLVVLGESGSGKTVLAIQLVLDLAHQLPSATYAPESKALVPVRFSVSAFSVNLARVFTVAAVRDHLDDWITEQLITVHGMRRPIARELIKQGFVIPILDGLDEMDPDGADPVRARAVIAALNLPTGHNRLRPVVITCRTDRYLHLADYPSIAGTVGVLEDAAVVTMQPLAIEQVCAWLSRRFADSTQPGNIQRRWRPVLTRVTNRPAGALATCLTSPLRLYLAVTAYQDLASKPNELCSIPAKDVDRHLLNRLIVATTTHHPRMDGSRYCPAAVTAWLRTFAKHLEWMGANGSSSTDINMHELWRSAELAKGAGLKIRHKAAMYSAGITLGAALINGSLFVVLSKRNLLIPLDPVVWQGLSWGAFLTLASGTIALAAPGNLRRLAPRQILTKEANRKIFYWTVGGLGAGLVGALNISRFVIDRNVEPLSLSVLIEGALLFASITIPVGLILGLGARPKTLARPSVVIRQGLAYDVYSVAVFAAAVGLGWWIGTGAFNGSILIWTTAFGMTLGTVFVAASPWSRYMLTVRSFSRTGNLPRRTAHFIDWAYDAGILRMSGNAFQFRHRDLQMRLTEADHPSSS